MRNMKTLFWGILFIVVVGVGGFFYRTLTEKRAEGLACPADARVCPDGTTLGRTGPSCTFPACPPPNVTNAELEIAFALPAGYEPTEFYGTGPVVAYSKKSETPDIEASDIVIHRYPITASSTAFQVIRETALQDGSGLPAPATAFSSAVIGGRQFSVVSIGRFEAVITTAYYLEWGDVVLRFDATDRGVIAWTDPKLNVSTLPAHTDIRELLGTLQGQI